MQIKRLDHVNVRTSRLDVKIDWYTDILGMRTGDRPDFPFPGAWLYTSEAVAVHLVGVEADAGIGSEVPLKLEHFAFSASGGKRCEPRSMLTRKPVRATCPMQQRTRSTAPTR